jgi:hypothetical protein
MNKYFSIFITCLISAVLFCGCAKELSVETNVVPLGTAATGSLKDSSSNCLPFAVQGTFYDGVIPGDTSYVQIKVNVYTAGSYNIQTDVQNGFQLSATGVFNNTGINTVNLKASGTPINIEATNLTVTFDGTSCIITVNVKDSTGTGLGGNTGANGGTTDTTAAALNQWKFTANGHTYSGNIIAALYTTLGENITVAGTMKSGSTDTTFGVSVQFTSSTIDTGTYATSDAGNNFALTKKTGDIIFAANAVSSPPVMNIIITNYNSSTKVITGTFSGVSYDFSGNNVPVTYGSFKATVTIQ